MLLGAQIIYCSVSQLKADREFYQRFLSNEGESVPHLEQFGEVCEDT